MAKQRHIAIAREIELLRAIINNTVDHMYVKDINSRFLFANDKVVEAMGAKCRADVIGKTDFDFHPPHLARQYLLDEQELFRTGKPLLNHEEPIFDHETGEVHWLSTSKVPFRDLEGQIVGLVGINRDITALKQAQRVLDLTRKRLALSEKVAALEILVTGIAHEINTPIGVSITAISHLKTLLDERFQSIDSGMLDQFRKLSELILQNLNRVADEVQTFRDLAVEHNTETRQRISLKEFLQDAILTLPGRTQTEQQIIQLTCPGSLYVNQYPGAILQILTILVSNAIVHGLESRPDGIVTITVTGEEESVIMEIKDNGRGMESSEKVHLFEPFFTTKRGRGAKGLGLTIAYNLVTQRLGGTITCISSTGEGTVFRITFPRDENNT